MGAGLEEAEGGDDVDGEVGDAAEAGLEEEPGAGEAVAALLRAEDVAALETEPDPGDLGSARRFCCSCVAIAEELHDPRHGSSSHRVLSIWRRRV